MLRAVGLHSGATVVIPSQVATIGAMSVACEYPNCRAIATTIIVIELGPLSGPSSVERLVCSTHVEQAQAIAKQHDAIAYRLYPR